MRKPAFCIYENKDADQLRGNPEADQRLCFRYTNGTNNPKFQASSHLLWLYSPVCVGPGRKPRRQVFSERGSILSLYKQASVDMQTGLCLTSSEILMTDFLGMRLIHLPKERLKEPIKLFLSLPETKK